MLFHSPSAFLIFSVTTNFCCGEILSHASPKTASISARAFTMVQDDAAVTRLSRRSEGPILRKRILDDLPDNEHAHFPDLPLNRQRSWEVGSSQIPAGGSSSPPRKRPRTRQQSRIEATQPQAPVQETRSEAEVRNLHRMGTLRAMHSQVPPTLKAHMLPLITKPVMQSKIINRYWNRKKEDKVHDFETWNSEVMFMNADHHNEFSEIADPVKAHVHQAIDQHQRQIPHVIEKAMKEKFRDPSLPITREQRPYAQAYLRSRTGSLHHDLNRELQQLHTPVVDAIHGRIHHVVNDKSKSAAADGHFYPLYYERYPNPENRVRSEYEGLARSHMQAIDEDPRRGMAKVHSILNPPQHIGYGLYERHAAKAGAA